MKSPPLYNEEFFESSWPFLIVAYASLCPPFVGLCPSSNLLGIIPNNTGGFGNADQALSVFMRNEIAPLQSLFETFNDWAGDELVRFAPYQPAGQAKS